MGELAQIVIQPRRKGGGEKLGTAEIISKEPRLGCQDDAEAREDGFIDARDMERWMIKTHGISRTWEPMNKLTLKRVK